MFFISQSLVHICFWQKWPKWCVLVLGFGNTQCRTINHLSPASTWSNPYYLPLACLPACLSAILALHAPSPDLLLVSLCCMASPQSPSGPPFYAFASYLPCWAPAACYYASLLSYLSMAKLGVCVCVCVRASASACLCARVCVCVIMWLFWCSPFMFS